MTGRTERRKRHGRGRDGKGSPAAAACEATCPHLRPVVTDRGGGGIFAPRAGRGAGTRGAHDSEKRGLAGRRGAWGQPLEAGVSGIDREREIGRAHV